MYKDPSSFNVLYAIGDIHGDVGLVLRIFRDVLRVVAPAPGADKWEWVGGPAPPRRERRDAGLMVPRRRGDRLWGCPGPGASLRADLLAYGSLGWSDWARTDTENHQGRTGSSTSTPMTCTRSGF